MPNSLSTYWRWLQLSFLPSYVQVGDHSLQRRLVVSTWWCKDHRLPTGLPQRPVKHPSNNQHIDDATVLHTHIQRLVQWLQLKKKKKGTVVLVATWNYASHDPAAYHLLGMTDGSARRTAGSSERGRLIRGPVGDKRAGKVSTGVSRPNKDAGFASAIVRSTINTATSYRSLCYLMRCRNKRLNRV
jgi:hypothetical protein